MNARPSPFPILVLCIALLAGPAWAQMVVQDGDIGFSRQELERIVEAMPSDMRRAAANDPGDRLEILNIALVNKKMAAQAKDLSPSNMDPDRYWQYRFQVQAIERKLVFEQFVNNLEVPDMSDLAEERYLTERDKFALVPEQRSSSHILFACPPGCDRVPVRTEALQVLDELRAGADFAEMVALHSEDPGSKNQLGKFDHWITDVDRSVAPQYRKAVFAIAEEGQYSELVETQFGVHIIRLDEIREQHYLSFEESRDKIVQALETEYKDLAAKEFANSFRMSDDVRIDGKVMEQIFGKYQTGE